MRRKRIFLKIPVGQIFMIIVLKWLIATKKSSDIRGYTSIFVANIEGVAKLHFRIFMILMGTNFVLPVATAYSFMLDGGFVICSRENGSENLFHWIGMIWLDELLLYLRYFSLTPVILNVISSIPLNRHDSIFHSAISYNHMPFPL